MQALMSYLNVRQLMPCARTAEICQDILGHRPKCWQRRASGRPMRSAPHLSRG